MTGRVGRRPAAAMLAVVAALGALAGCSSPAGAQGGPPDTGFVSGDGTLTTVPAGRRAAPPRLAGSTLDGKPFDVSSLRGKVVVVNVWASWCGPCKREQPVLERVHRATAPLGVAFLGIDARDDPLPAARAHVRRYGVTYPSLHDPDSRLLLAFRDLPPSAIPTTILLDRQGRVAGRVLGEVRESTLRGLLDDLLAEPRA